MKCFVNFVNQDNGEEDAYKIVGVPAEAGQKMDAWIQDLIQEMKPIQQELDKKFGASHSLLIVVKDGAEEVFSLHTA
ncbi:hypothetical protein [Acidaminococcus timonensis]|uniref:hypothetical protein n=1 Tax=Acidaminococcus timonensis TaxID=1871002 RepID=UPI0008D9A114|nr:hypothetical protein [Acidaminococcus timonensis]